MYPQRNLNFPKGVLPMSKKTVIKGAMILAITGILTRFIGFGYRIFLSNLIGAAQLGIYQMIFPVFGICATIYGAGIQTAISHVTAAEQEKHVNSSISVLLTGILLSLSLSLSLSALIFLNADVIAEKFLMESACTEPLKILVILFPFCGVASCMNGWYYGKQKTAIPAASQLLEQCTRVSVVFALSFLFSGRDILSGCELAVAGMCAGEIFSCIFTLVSFSLTKKEPFGKYAPYPILKQLLHLAVPLTGNRLIVNLLASAEAVLIPACLKKYGLSPEEALSVYGILTGMSLPFLMFPSTITNSLAVLLLPSVAQAQSTGNKKQIERTCQATAQFCLLIGLLSMTIFLVLGNSIGNYFFHNHLAGKYLTTLSWLCPFLYLTTTLGSILNGMNKAGTTLFNNVTGLGIRLLFVLYCIPTQGMEGYLIGVLAGQLATFFLDVLAISREIKIEWNLMVWIVKPGITLSCSGFLISHCFRYFNVNTAIPEIICIAGAAAALFLVSIPYFYKCIKSV